MLQAPGEKFLYNNDLVNVLIHILERVTRYSAYDFAQKYIFTPLDFGEFQWMMNDGVVYGSHGLVITARDMAKFGLLYLNQGVFNSRRIVSADWVSNSTSYHTNISSYYEDYGFSSYGYLWWLWESEGFNGSCALGALEQRIFIDPEHDMVVVTQCGHIEKYFSGLVENYIFPSILSRDLITLLFFCNQATHAK